MQSMEKNGIYYKSGCLNANGPRTCLSKNTHCNELVQGIGWSFSVSKNSSDVYMHNSAVKMQLQFLQFSFGIECQIKWKTLPSTLSKKIILKEYFFSYYFFLNKFLILLICLDEKKIFWALEGKQEH